MPTPSLRSVWLLAGLALAFAACDSATLPQDAPGPSIHTAEDAAAIVAAVAVAPGGALHDLAGALLALDRGAEGPGCSAERAWDAPAQRWIHDVACTRGQEDGPAYAHVARTVAYQFLSGGAPVQQPPQAEAMTVEVLAAAGILRTPRRSSTLTDLQTTLAVANLDQPMVTVDGAYLRSAVDSTFAQNRLLTVKHTLSLELDQIVGPRRAVQPVPPRPNAPPLSDLHRLWARAVSGTLTGTLTGVRRIESPEGVREHPFERSFTITFGGDDDATATIAFGDTGERVRADFETGRLLD